METRCLVSRQPVFDSNVSVAAYELRSHLIVDQTDMSAEDVARAALSPFTRAALDEILGNELGIITLTPAALAGGLWQGIPSDRIVLGYFEQFNTSDETAERVSRLVAEGYRLALSDKLPHATMDHFAKLAQFIRVDVTRYTPDDLQKRALELRCHKASLFAENVVTYDDLEFSRSLAFDLYQGQFLCKMARPTSDLSLNRLAMIRVVSKLQDPELKMADLEKLISQDVALSYRLLRYINSFAVALRSEITSVGHAVRMVGIERLKTWTAALLLAAVDDKPRELTTVALVRARMCERLAEAVNSRQKESFFFAGLLSVLEALLDCPMETALADLSLSDGIRKALIEQSGPMGEAVRCAIAYEQPDWGGVQFQGLSLAQIRDSYLEAISWATQLQSELHV